jgi:putative membrane protein
MEEQNLGRPQTPKEYLRLYLTGFAMGTADIIPGVSGGTIAFIMGIYDTLVDAIKSFNLDAIRLVFARKFAEFVDHVSLRFLIALGLGIITAVLLLSNILGTLLETQPTFVFAFFGGLVLASIVAVSSQVHWTSTAFVALVIGAILGFIITGSMRLIQPASPTIT